MTEPSVEELLAVIPEVEGSRADFDRKPATTSSAAMLPRPEGMSRQVHRRLYRLACQAVGIEPQLARPTDKKEARRLRKQLGRLDNDRAPRGTDRNRSHKVRYLNLP